jgi:hypothetical protein
MLRLARRARFSDGIPYRHHIAASHQQRAEVRERRLVTILGGDRHREAVRRHLTGKRDLARRRSSYHPGIAESDVDASVLSACVRVVADRELPEDGAVGRPGPTSRS